MWSCARRSSVAEHEQVATRRLQVLPKYLTSTCDGHAVRLGRVGDALDDLRALGVRCGGNAQASRLAGLPVARVQMSVCLLSGFCAAVGGIFLASQLGAGAPQAAGGIELSVIAAVILRLRLCGL